MDLECRVPKRRVKVPTTTSGSAVVTQVKLLKSKLCHEKSLLNRISPLESHCLFGGIPTLETGKPPRGFELRWIPCQGFTPRASWKLFQRLVASHRPQKQKDLGRVFLVFLFCLCFLSLFTATRFALALETWRIGKPNSQTTIPPLHDGGSCHAAPALCLCRRGDVSHRRALRLGRSAERIPLESILRLGTRFKTGCFEGTPPNFYIKANSSCTVIYQGG